MSETEYWKFAAEAYKLTDKELMNHLLTTDGRGKTFKLACFHEVMDRAVSEHDNKLREAREKAEKQDWM